MNAFFTFIEKHKSFIKKLLIFAIVYLVLTIANNPAIIGWFETIFGPELTIGIKSVPVTYLVTSEV